MLNESQQAWLKDAKPKDIQDLFRAMRTERLDSLNKATPDYEQGRMIQDEIAASHRIEKWLTQQRNTALEQDKIS
jgi:hypothetical protein